MLNRCAEVKGTGPFKLVFLFEFCTVAVTLLKTDCLRLLPDLLWLKQDRCELTVASRFLCRFFVAEEAGFGCDDLLSLKELLTTLPAPWFYTNVALFCKLLC